ncbi:mobilization protein [Streptacidiphilus sp. P02-A3a]|uniref:relaxase/mobilization nuclease domain-containing protein n=1 Tax=Streptacidiphilus sp. P02-A3a TaxID=2704468 RepID=UPI0015F8AB1C|nr:mobilization protein [Streptacidiphilus sp. P02-A3a]QMU67099.1 mobilization protein [Streptacidiphilus sp. P02-A3a]
MIASVTRGDRTRGILAYVYGPGDEDEHTNQHTVAAYEPLLPDPGLAEDPQRALTRLAKILDLRVAQAGAGAPKDHVWHCSLRAAPEDRHLSDSEWEQIAHRVMHAARIAPTGDPDGCRWVVVRHAEDHIHIVATTVRADLTGARLHNDWQRVMDELTLIEQDYGLRQVPRETGGRRTARTTVKRPTRAEIHKAKLQGLPEPSRAVLRTAVRESLAGAVSEDEFLGRLAGHGVQVKVHRLPSGDAKGYSFHLPGDRKTDGQPLWYSGSSLGPDLSLPKIRARLSITADEPDPAIAQARSARPALQQAGRLADQALDSFTAPRPGAEEADGEVWQVWAAGFGEVLDAFAQTHRGSQRAQIVAAAKAYGQAAYLHERAAEKEMRALRSTARAVLAGGPSHGALEGDAIAAFLDVLVLIAVTLYRSHRAAGHTQQALIAQATAGQLRAAYAQAAARPLIALKAQGERLPPTARDHATAAVHQALPPELAARVLGGKDWSALAATLAQAQHLGHSPAALLQQTLGAREMDSADNPATVLLWRIRRTTALPAPAAAKPAKRKPTMPPAPAPRPAIAPAPPTTRRR